MSMSIVARGTVSNRSKHDLIQRLSNDLGELRVTSCIVVKSVAVLWYSVVFWFVGRRSSCARAAHLIREPSRTGVGVVVVVVLTSSWENLPVGDAPPPKTAGSFGAAFAGHPRIQDSPLACNNRVTGFMSF